MDVVEGQKLGVEVADGHVIKHSVTGNIKISMQDDNENWLNATLKEVMYVPGLSRHLFSVTKFAQHGHHAIIMEQRCFLNQVIHRSLSHTHVVDGKWLPISQ